MNSKKKPTSTVATVSSVVSKRNGEVVRITSKYDLTPKKVDTHLVTGILRIFVALILFLRFTGLLFDTGSNISFSSFLEWIDNFKAIDISWLPTLGDKLVIAGDWGLFDFFRSFINTVFLKPIQVMLFVSISLLNLIYLLLKFIGFIFGVAL